MIIKKKHCIKCSNTLPVTLFYTNNNAKDKLYSYCIQCSKEVSRMNKHNYPANYADGVMRQL